MLKPGGKDIAVTQENKLQYVHLAAEWYLSSRLGQPTEAFAQGLAQVRPPCCSVHSSCAWRPEMDGCGLIHVRLRWTGDARHGISRSTLAMKRLAWFYDLIWHQQAAAECGCQVIPPAWLRLFNQHEVNELLSGGASGGADANDMRAYAVYSGGYSPTSRSVKLLWQVRLQAA